MTGSNTQHDSRSIGLSKIWSEGEGVEAVSLRALAAHVVRRSYENLARSPVTASLTVITIAVALFLLGFFSLLVDNSRLAIANEGGEIMVTVFLKDTVAQSDAEELARKVQALAGRSPIAFTDKTEALGAFRRLLGDDAVILDGLEKENPLPASIDVRLTSAAAAEKLHRSILDSLGSDSRIDSIRYSRGVVNQINRILRLLEITGVLGIVFLLIITGFIISNTIKLALYSHRMEVEIMELVGARSGSIYAPYVLEGALQGLCGAVSGLLLVFFAFLFLRNALGQTELLSALFPSFHFLSLSAVVGIIVAGVVVGMTCSFFAVRRFLSEV